jgi:hypothetical protein
LIWIFPFSEVERLRAQRGRQGTNRNTPIGRDSRSLSARPDCSKGYAGHACAWLMHAIMTPGGLMEDGSMLCRGLWRDHGITGRGCRGVTDRRDAGHGGWGGALLVAELRQTDCAKRDLGCTPPRRHRRDTSGGLAVLHNLHARRRLGNHANQRRRTPALVPVTRLGISNQDDRSQESTQDQSRQVPYHRCISLSKTAPIEPERPGFSPARCRNWEI